MRKSFEGVVLLSPFTGEVVGVGLDPIGAYADAEWRLDQHRRELFDKGYRTTPAKVTVTFKKGACRRKPPEITRTSKEQQR